VVKFTLKEAHLLYEFCKRNWLPSNNYSQIRRLLDRLANAGQENGK
jgi:hypothetical protein